MSTYNVDVHRDEPSYSCKTVQNKLQDSSEQDAQLGIESVGHIGKDSNNNRRK